MIICLLYVPHSWCYWLGSCFPPTFESPKFQSSWDSCSPKNPAFCIMIPNLTWIQKKFHFTRATLWKSWEFHIIYVLGWSTLFYRIKSIKIAFKKYYFTFWRNKKSLLGLQGDHMQQVQQIYCYYCAVEKNNAKSMG